MYSCILPNLMTMTTNKAVSALKAFRKRKREKLERIGSGGVYMIAYVFDAFDAFLDSNILLDFFSMSGVACSALVVKFLFSRKG